MNSDEMWLLQLWSGTFGATIGAIAAAAVAILVVTLTNRHQSKLTERSLELQATLARESQEELRRQAASAEEAQERALRLQLEVQRQEASKERLTFAVAEALTVAHELSTSFPLIEMEIARLHRRLYGAVFRWYIENPEEPGIVEVLAWPNYLYNLTRQANAELEDETDRKKYFDVLLAASAEFQSAASRWPNSSAEHRNILVAHLSELREQSPPEPHDQVRVQVSAQLNVPAR
ncbi:hypothetical protein [Arthrobacter sp. StoSoilB22]|uniref:hypothetical protein n=1 Tax=Arthrobacter sp. StoSoilB22 TaxID=2830996 RepID=UPI001CC4B013|nr:hypothetical protein [Arthrobacter sp. StoSoilB22]BCW62852.1 hypothetical protein StoSoilB22_18250 [Arthrobacter sp. StoSoilB22]